MPLGEIVFLLVFLVLLLTLTWRLVYVYFMKNNDLSDIQIYAIKRVRSILNTTLNGGTVQTTSTENLKKLKIKKSKIINKMDELTELISNKTGIPTQFITIEDPFLNEEITIKELEDDKLRKHSLVSEYSTIKTIIRQLISENIFPTNSDFEYINTIYKKFKKISIKNDN